MIKKILIIVIKLWRFFAKRTGLAILGYNRACRFYPSCSMYCEEAIVKFGLIKGLRIGILRILRCHPLTKPGFDPVPLK